MPDDAGSRFEMARAELADLDDVVLVLEEASAWLRSRGIHQWPAKFSADWIGPSIRRGETWLATVGGHLAGTITLSSVDPAWPDDAGDAAYVHRLAVRRGSPGRGRALLDWAAATAQAQHRSLLRLDCVSSNVRLRRYYEEAGFQPRGEASIHGATVTLFERPTERTTA